MVVDVWLQHPTRRFMRHEMFESIRKWTGQQIPEEEQPFDLTVQAMDDAGVGYGLLSAWHAPGGFLITNDEVAAWVETHPDRFGGLAAVNLDKPMDAVRELRRCIAELDW